MKNILFIYDFDDTLFPSYNYTFEKQFNNKQWVMLDNIIYSILYNSLSIGKIIILSDAMELWINTILNNLPKSNNLIKDNITIFTTNKYLIKYQYNFTYLYKYQILRKLINKYNFKYIVNIGDGYNEYIATLLLHKNFNINITHIKMLKKPSFYQLYNELIILNNNINLMNNDNNKEYFFKLNKSS